MLYMLDVSIRFQIRAASLADVSPLTALLNKIIESGGTTALETPLSHTEFAAHFLLGPQVLSCFVAEDDASKTLLGFQSLERHRDLPEDWGDIATFAQPTSKQRGVGTALFAATIVRARELGLVAINATIRADNRGGLAFYEKMGFTTYRVLEAVPLRDGTPVDRISKRHSVG